MFGINDPSALLRPWRNLQQFSEELYAMFSKGGAREGTPANPSRGEPTPDSPARRTESEQARFDLNSTRKARLESARGRVVAPEVPGRDSHATNDRTPKRHDSGPPRERPIFSAPVETGPPPQPTPTERRQKEGQSPSQATLPTQPVRERNATPERKPKPHEPSREYVTPAEYRDRRAKRDGDNFKTLDIGEFANQVGGGSGGTTTFIGLVVSGTGNTYQVTLYQNGPDGTPDASPVTVKIPMIDPTDHIPPSVWISPIFQFSDSSGNPTYSCQPPVWMA